MTGISIHALRVEGDKGLGRGRTCSRNFYPRPPGGGRRCCGINGFFQTLFLSTPSGWRATRPQSPHRRQQRFLSTPSGWRATSKIPITNHYFLLFLSTPSGWRATCGVVSSMWTVKYFYPRPPGGGRRANPRTFSSVFAQKGEEFASLRRGKRKICRWRFKKDKFWVLIWCEGSGKSVCALASHCG